MSLRCGHLSLISALSILFGGKFKFSTIQARFTLILPAWEPLDMEKVSNFDFILILMLLMRQHSKTGFLFLAHLSLNNQLKILIWPWNQILNLVVRLLKVKTCKYVVVLFCCGFLFILLQLNSGLDKCSIFSKCDTSVCKYLLSVHRSQIKLLFKVTLGGSCKNTWCSLLQFCSQQIKLDLQSLTIWVLERQLKQSLLSFTKCLLSEILLFLKLEQPINLWLFLQSQHFKLRLSDKFSLMSLSILVKLTKVCYFFRYLFFAFHDLPRYLP